MKELVPFLEKSSVQYLATIGCDQKPKVRPFQFMFESDKRLWFCTANSKEVYRELLKNPAVELCASSGSGDSMSWLRLSGMVQFSNDISMKEKVFERSPLVKSIYKDAMNPHFELFYLHDIFATISAIGKEPYVVSV